MHHRTTVAGLAGVFVASTTLLVATSVNAEAAPVATARTTVPVVVAHVNSKHISLSTGPTLHAGRMLFKVVTAKGDHTLQALRLHPGYTLQQAETDVGKAFQGDLAAIHRIDHRITWRGGAETKPGKPGWFQITLTAGHYVLVDQNSSAVKMVNVVGRTRLPRSIPHSSHITAFSYGFGTSRNVLPHRGWTLVTNQADQPHFVVFQHVKRSTTPLMVRRYFKSQSQANPPWALRATTTMGVISPKRGEVFHYDLPRGKYLIACFWPDDETGMPHAYMGMWKLIELR